MAINDVTRPWSEGTTDSDSDSEQTARWEALVDPAEPERDESDDLADSSMALYLRDISRVPLLTAEEEVILAKALEGGEAAHAMLGAGAMRGAAPELAPVPELTPQERRQLEDQARPVSTADCWTTGSR